MRGELERLTFLGVYEYTVQRAAAGTVDAVPSSSLPLPPVTGAPLVSSLLGQAVTPAATGATCRIRFVNGDPSRPVCTGLGAPSADATIDASGTLSLGPSAQRVTLAGGSLPLSRDGDAATIFLPPGTLIGIVTPPGSPPVTVGLLTVLSAVTGIISGGSRATA